MKTFLACCGIDGDTRSLTVLKDLISQWRPEAVLFAGGLFAPAPSTQTLCDAAELHQFEIALLDSFFSVLSAQASFAAAIPGPADAPLRILFRAAVYNQTNHPGVHLVHAKMATKGNVAVYGIGGALTSDEDTWELVVRSSRPTAEYFLQGMLATTHSQNVLLFAEPPKGKLDGEAGNTIVRDLIDTCRPKLCVVGGATAYRGVERVARTTIVNPGRLSDGCAALADWSTVVDDQVELLQLS